MIRLLFLLLITLTIDLCSGTRFSSRSTSAHRLDVSVPRCKNRAPKHTLFLLLALLTVSTPLAAFNGDFETGNFVGWTADPNWTIANDGRGFYTGWQGRYWAWSGGKGEAATGKLKSRTFVLDKPAVRMTISGWDSIFGTGNPRKWNYVTLNLENGTEIDRVYAPNTTAFVPAYLDGSKHKGKKVYVEAVDDADQPSFSMLCLDDVRTADMPEGYSKPAPRMPAFDHTKSIRLQNDACLIDVSRSNGSVTRIRDKRAGLDLILEPRLAGSYRFALMIPGGEPWQTLEANWIFGRDNKLSSYYITTDKLILRWDGPLKNYLGAKFSASVTETIQLSDGGALFTMSVDNKSIYPVGEVYFPIIGGLQGLGRTIGQLKSTEMIRPAANDSFTTASIFFIFTNVFPFGDQGPEQAYAYPEAQPEPWVAFSSAKAGRAVYIGARDPLNRKQVIRLEMFPASSGTPRDDGNWPRPEELKGIPVGVELSFVDIANFPCRQIYHAAPVFLKFVGCDRPELRKIFGDWKARGASGG
jgi:hypothetical protein